MVVSGSAVLLESRDELEEEEEEEEESTVEAQRKSAHSAGMLPGEGTAILQLCSSQCTEGERGSKCEKGWEMSGRGREGEREGGRER